MGWKNTGDEMMMGCQWKERKRPNPCMHEDPDRCMGNHSCDVENEPFASGDTCEDMDDVEIDEPDADVEKMLDGSDDDYQYEDSDEDEPLEYDSDEEQPLEYDSDEGMLDVEETCDSDIEADVEDNTYTLFKRSCTLKTDPPPPPKHNCFRGTGYDGKCITAEEMRGCYTAQALLSKTRYSATASAPFGANDPRPPSIGTPAPFDQDFERESSFCLSGLVGRVVSTDGGEDDFLPSRHGVAYAHLYEWVRALSLTIFSDL